MGPLRRLPFLVLLMCMAVAVSTAQEQPNLTTTHITEPARVRQANDSALFSTIFTLSSDVEEVQVRFAASDRTGRPVPPLHPGDVQVLTDGRFSPEIKSFGPLRAAPITLGIVLDLSESVHSEMHHPVMEFSDAVGEILQPNRDREFVVAFSNRIASLQPPTADFSQVKRALERSSATHDLTSLYDAIVRTCREQFGTGSNSRDEQRILLLFSDGLDNLSIHSLDDAVDAAVSAGVSIYAVAPRAGAEEGRKVLEQLAERTGGSLELLHKKGMPILTVAAIRAMAGNEYALSFRPPNGRPGFHRIELKATAEPSLVLHARGGYFLNAKHH